MVFVIIAKILTFILVHACKPLNAPKNGEYRTSNGLLQMACKKGYVPETKSSMYICRNGNWHELFSGKVVTSLPDCVKVNIKLQGEIFAH